MTNLVKQASLPVADAPVVVRETKYVMLYNEMEDAELQQLKLHFDVYVFDPKADYKLTIADVFKDCELLIIDVRDKDAVFWWSEQRPRIDDGAFQYDCKLLYKARKGSKIDIPKLKALYAVHNVIKYLPDDFIKNGVEYVRRLLIDHIPDADKGCGLFGCLKKSE